jgi:hypothetical protein
LRNYSITSLGPQSNGGVNDECAFRIQPLDKETGYKTYTLYTKNGTEMKEWVDILKKAKNLISTPFAEESSFTVRHLLFILTKSNYYLLIKFRKEDGWRKKEKKGKNILFSIKK